MAKVRRKRMLWAATGGYATALAVVSVLPSGTGPLAGWDTAISPGLQNLLHVPAYGLLVWLVAKAMGLGRAWQLALAAVACAAFGGLLECAQAAIPGRFGSVTDMLLNGLVLGYSSNDGRHGRLVRPCVSKSGRHWLTSSQRHPANEQAQSTRYRSGPRGRFLGKGPDIRSKAEHHGRSQVARAASEVARARQAALL